MTTSVATRRNGVGAPMPIKAVLIECDNAGYPGWYARLRTNIPARVYDDFVAQDENRFWASLQQIVVEWNFADTEGEPLPTPANGLSWIDLPFDLAQHLVRSYVEAFTVATQVPKASVTNSASTSATDAVPQTSG